MFPPIFALALDHVALDNVTVTDDESLSRVTSDVSREIPRPIFNRVRHEQQSESLLSVLDDKNRMISSLKKQLQNQKMQLSYYIKRELSRNKIQQLSESCTPQAFEESLPLNLAINKFCKQAGIKTKLLLLHERMNRLDYKISNTLKDQEFVLRKIVNKLCEFVRVQEMSRASFKDQFGTFITDPLHVNLFDKLLTATLSLGRKLDSFKISCDRVILIEEERNAIVEQVYSLPVEERINCNYLLGIQMEKAQLENEIKRISQHQATSRHRIKELNVIEKILHNLQWELNSSFLKNEESCISKMVRKINSEARILLEMTKEQKRRFECELSKTKCPEPNRVIFFINMASEGDKFEQKDFDRYGIKSEEDVRFFKMVKAEVDSLKAKTREEADEEMKTAKNECEVLKEKITEVSLETSRTKSAKKILEEELEELKLEQRNGIQVLKQERDAYKSQVEDLQAIREAYAQLVDKQPNSSQMEIAFLKQVDQKDNRILELEKQVAAQRGEIEQLKARISDQNDQIVVLNRFINLTRPNSPRDEKLHDANFDLDTGSCCSLSATKFNHHPVTDRGYDKTNKTREESKQKKLNYMFARYRRRGPGTKKFAKGSIINGSSYKRNLSKYSKEIHGLMSNSFETLSQLDQESLSQISIFSQKHGKSEDIVHRTVRGDEEAEGKLKLGRSSHFSLEIKYQNSDIDRALFELDDYEIFKDVSRESVVLENRYASMSRPLRFN